MSQVTPALIKELREKTGAGIMDAKKALTETSGDVQEAVSILRKQGQVKAQKKAQREVKEGIVEAYIHANKRVGAIVELNCETDFVARNDEFKALAHDIAMQVTAMNAQYLAPENVPAEIVEQEKEIYREQLKTDTGQKPVNIQEKIIEGKIQKFYADACLLKQSFFKDDSMTIEELIAQKVSQLGENIKVKGFSRMSLQ